VSAIAEKELLVRDVVRLRRAERISPARDEIAAVRSDLERVVGPTVTRAMAARLLGVSQTALDRWIALGDVPVVVGRGGRREVPLQALVELVEARDQSERSGRDAHPLAHVMGERRARAHGPDIESVVRDLPRASAERGHRKAELRGLAYHRVVARRLDRMIVQTAHDRLRRWRAEGRIDPRYAREWEHVLAETPTRIAQLIAEDSPRMRDLRQSSPFAGVLSEPERRALHETLNEALG
jgi:hypothetical protein